MTSLLVFPPSFCDFQRATQEGGPLPLRPPRVRPQDGVRRQGRPPRVLHPLQLCFLDRSAGVISIEKCFL